MRLRAKQMKEGDDVAGLDVDHDETYNADEEGIKSIYDGYKFLPGAPTPKCLRLR